MKVTQLWRPSVKSLSRSGDLERTGRDTIARGFVVLLFNQGYNKGLNDARVLQGIVKKTID